MSFKLRLFAGMLGAAALLGAVGVDVAQAGTFPKVGTYHDGGEGATIEPGPDPTTVATASFTPGDTPEQLLQCRAVERQRLRIAAPTGPAYPEGMRNARARSGQVTLTALMLGVSAVGCGFDPPAAAPTSSVTAADCGPGPADDTLQAEVSMLPPGSWRETSRGRAADCRLQWVVVTDGAQPDSPQQVLFFDGAEPVGSPTIEPRPYITVTAQGEHDAVVQYQWSRGQDEPCCPTGIGSARVTLEDGRLTVLDPIPNE